MNSNDTGSEQDRRSGRGGRRPSNRRPGNRDRRDSRGPRQDSRNEPRRPAAPAKKPTFWQRLIGFFTGGKKAAETNSSSRSERGPRKEHAARAPRASRPVEIVEVTNPRLYVGNLSYDASESDLYELFNGVGKVQNAEIVTLKGTYKSKGFGFVTMITVDEAKRAVATLHDKPFMGRNLVVSGSKSDSQRDAFDTR